MRPLALLTDFGLADAYVGVVHAVLVREAPGCERIDLGHTFEPGDVWGACFALGCAWPHLPADTVVVAVVDPGVGGTRRALAVRHDDRWLVAPDNGLAAALGPPAEARALEWQRLGLEPPSATFHGRDLFAPAAARIARGDEPSTLGPTVAATSLVGCPLPAVEWSEGRARATILHVDRFGNLVTNLRVAEVPPGPTLRVDGLGELRRVRTYGEANPDELVVLEGSSGHLELALDRHSAAASTGVGRGDRLTVG